MKKGDIVLIHFPFTDLSGNRLRPALVLAEYNNELIVCFISSVIKTINEYDIIFEPDKENNLKKTSVLKVNKIATLEKELFLGKIGVIKKTLQKDIDKKLSLLLCL